MREDISYVYHMYMTLRISCLLHILIFYMFIYFILPGEKSLSPVTIVVTPTHLFLTNENYNYPLPRLPNSAPIEYKEPQYQLRDKQGINDITSMVKVHCQ